MSGLRVPFLAIGAGRQVVRQGEEIENIKQLAGQGKSIREIAKELNISKSKVGRILKM